MDDHNFWYWILAQMQDFLLTYFLPMIPRHVDWGLAQTTAEHARPALGLMFVTVGELVHLGTIVRVLQIVLIMEAVKLFISLRKTVARMIKLGATFGLA